MSYSSSPSATSEKPKVVACPRCGASVAWDPANPYRPFCSARCKTIDLGAWATESYRIPIVEDNDTPADDESGAPARKS